MDKPIGFLEFGRELPENRDPQSRIEDSKEIQLEFDSKKLNK
ncbi:MAG: glutamate synthase (NADPH/NADH) small chain [Bacteroidia bacterium]|jgi:glutamate synthase (NADPH/NADH) small chain